MEVINYLKEHIILVLLFLTALIDVCCGQPLFIRCLLLVLLIAITLTDDFVFSLPLVLMLNDGLGTAIGSFASFYWVTAILIFVRIIIKKEFLISKKTAIFVVLGLLYTIFLYFVQYDTSIRQPSITFIYFLIIAYVIEQVEQGKVSLKSIALAFGIAVTIAAIHMGFFGGVDYTTFGHEGDDGVWKKTTRYGIIGAGAGDPNFSGLRLLFGLVCLWSSNIKKILKAILSILFVYCIVMTVSITTFLILLLMILFGLFIQQGTNKKIKIVIGIALGIVLLYVLIIVFPISDIADQISLYYYRLQSKLNFLSTRNIGELTTGRSNNALMNLKYALDRDPLKLLFGFDSIPLEGTLLAHNTYVDALVHFGIIGAIIYIGIIIKRVIFTIRKRCLDYEKDGNLILCLKFLFAAFSFTLSIYSGADVALLSWILLFM